jgi:flavodoxin
MTTIVYYYSRKGSNRFLATRIADDLKCEIENIKHRLNELQLALSCKYIISQNLKTS